LRHIFQAVIFEIVQTAMDGLSTTASGIAVGSSAIQVAENIKRLFEFWQSITEAPASIGAMTGDLSLFSSVLTEIAARDQQHGQNETTRRILKSCTSQVCNGRNN
jgi:hypothetical protein